MNTTLSQARWADLSNSQLVSKTGVQPVQMAHSYGTASPLLCDESQAKRFGADLIRFEADKGVGLHTHVGAHILFVTHGEGVLIYRDERYPMTPGMIYLIESNAPHAIEPTTELVIIAIGNDHQPAGSESRLDIVQQSK